MHRWSGALAFMAGAALITTATGTALAQEESPAPEVSMAAEASPAATVVEPSTLSVLQVATNKAAGTKIKGKKYVKAIQKAAPNAVAYLTAADGGDVADRVIQTVLLARAGDAEENYELADAYIGLATAIYRNGWTAAGTEPIELNGEIDQAVSERYAGQDGLSIFPPEGTSDICITPQSDWIIDPSAPWECLQGGGLALRVDASLVDGAKNETKELYAGPPEGLDVGFALHQVAQNERADIPLKGKKYRKAIAEKAPTIAAYVADGSGAGRMNGIFDLVLLAREADEAGNKKAAKAFMALALATFRKSLTTSEQSPGEFVTALHELGQTTYEGQPGVALLPPSGFDLICLNKKKNGLDYFAAPEDLWACTGQGGKVLFVAEDDPDLDPAQNGAAEGLYTGEG